MISENIFRIITPRELEDAFVQTDQLFLSGGNSVDSGCTAVVALYNRVNGHLITANCGDARCLVSRGGKAQVSIFFF